MPIVTGTSGDDKLRGRPGDDLLQSNGGNDILLGKGGADTYVLFFGGIPRNPAPTVIINETKGGDGSLDQITGVAGLTQYNFGDIEFTRFSRTGPNGDHLTFQTAEKVGYYTTPGAQSGTVKIVNQYDPTTPGAQIEVLKFGSIEYNLLTTDTGGIGNDIITGWRYSDTLSGGDGNDYISGGGKRDYLYGDAGNDTLFGDSGSDFIYGGADNDWIFGDDGNDRAWGGDGADSIFGGAGRDVLRGEDGDDNLDGGDGNDLLFGGLGNDKMIGQKGRDVYVVSALTADADTIDDKGQAISPTQAPYVTANLDELQITDFANLNAAIHGVGFAVSGDDLVITYQSDAMAFGDEGSVTVIDHFLGGKNVLELVSFGTGSPTYHLASLSGDNFTYSVHGGADANGEDIVLGTVGGDEIYGGIGNDILVGFGGSDVFMFHDEEDNGAGSDIILDFDIAEDVLDFADIAGFDFTGITVTQNADGNAVIASVYCMIELDGVVAADDSEDIFAFS